MFQFSVGQDTLLSAISQAQRATATRIIQPILSHLLIESEGNDTLKISATDLDFAIETRIQAVIKTPGKATMSAKKLLEIVTKLSKEDVLISADVATGLARIECGNSVFDVRTLPAEEFPVIKQIDGENSFSLPLSELRKSIQYTVFAAASSENNNVLSGVFFKLTPTEIEMAATDGSRLARSKRVIEANTVKEPVSAIIPAKTLQEFLRLSQVDSSATVTVSIKDGQIAFRTPQFYILSRLLDGQYPQYEQLIPADYKDIAFANRDALIKSLERTAVMANERTNIVKMRFENGQLSMAAQTPDLGDSRDSMTVAYDGDELDIAFNYKFVLDAVRVIDTDEVRLELKSGLAPTLFKSAQEEAQYLCLVMPVQVK